MASHQNFLKLVENPEDAKIDIVAVHGLNFRNTESHAEKTWTSENTNKLWLRDFLPSKVPYARIFIFGYNSNVAFQTSCAGLSEQAGSLLNLVSLNRKHSCRRPLIFICHSLGGIVVKEALVQSKLDPFYSDVEASTYGIAFFGTPHRGGRNAKLGSIVANILRAIQGNPKNTFMEALKGKSSPFSDDVVKKFRLVQQNYSILSFYETRPMGKLGLIVEPQSATLGSGSHEKQIPIDADHRQMCKFGSDNDPAYDQVSKNIIGLIENAIQGGGRLELSTYRDPANHAREQFEALELTKKEDLEQRSLSRPLKNDEQVCLRSIWFPELEARFHDINDAAKDTCQWLSSHSTFLTWRQRKSGILWIKGSPGAGKSTLVKYALQNCPDGIISASYFFNRRGASLEYTLLGFYRSLLYQLLPVVPEHLSKMTVSFMERCQARGRHGEKWDWHESELRSLLSKVLLSAASRPVTLFIDALDEGGEENAVDLIQDLQDLVDQAVDMNASLLILLSRRHYPIISLDGLSIEVEKENFSDISMYVRRQFRAHSISLTATHSLATTILERVSGIFQWIKLVLPRVISECKRGKSIEAIQKTIKKLPPQLHELYQVLLTEVPDEDRPLSVRLLRLVLFAKRPLTITEIRHAIIMDPDRTYKSWQEHVKMEDFADTDEDMQRRVIDLSRGLLEINVLEGETDNYDNSRSAPSKNVVQIMHESVADYLINEKGLHILSNSDKSTSTCQEHVKFAWICIRYMFLDEITLAWRECNESFVHSFDWLETSEKLCRRLSTSYPFLDYSIDYWIKHAAASDQSEDAVQNALELFQYFQQDCEHRTEHWASLYRSKHHHLFESKYSDVICRCRTIQHIIASEGMCNLLVQLNRSNEVDMDVVDCGGKTPLHIAAIAGQETMVKLLIERADVNISALDECGNTPLTCAASCGHLRIVKMLLEQDDIRADARYRNGRTLLSIAAEWGDGVMARLLLEHYGVEADSRDDGGRTPLSYAAGSGSELLVRQLLELPGVEVDSRDENGRTPLSYAADLGFQRVVMLLLERSDIDVETRRWLSKRPLEYVIRGE